MTLVEILERNAKEIPDKVAVVYQDINITYRELNEEVNKLAGALMVFGIMPGDRVGFMLHRAPELIVTFLAVAKCRGIVVPVNFELLPGMIKGVIETTGLRFMIVQDKFVSLARRSVPEGSKVTVIVAGECSIDGDYSWHDVLKGRKTKNPSLDVSEDSVVYLNYTSGSTGNPKGAVTTYSNIFWNTVAAIEALKINRFDIHLCMFAPFAHPHEIFSRSLYSGGTTVLLESIYPKAIIKSIMQNKVTCFMGLAPMYETLLDACRKRPNMLGSLRVAESGGMFTRIDLIKRFEQSIGIPVLPVWGSTETTGIAIANSPGENQKYGSVGKACMFYDVKVVDEEGRELPPDNVGEMVFKGPAVVSGYYEDCHNDVKGFRDGWYYSGDLGKMDTDGHFWFAGRKSGMMKVAGLMVYPLEIEIQLMSHPCIKEAAVIGVEDRLRGQVPKAIVVLKDGQKMTEREIIRFCSDHLAHYKVPKVVEFRESLPRIGMGKIDMKALLQMEER